MPWSCSARVYVHGFDSAWSNSPRKIVLVLWVGVRFNKLGVWFVLRDRFFAQRRTSNVRVLLSSISLFAVVKTHASWFHDHH